VQNSNTDEINYRADDELKQHQIAILCRCCLHSERTSDKWMLVSESHYNVVCTWHPKQAVREAATICPRPVQVVTLGDGM